MATTHEHRRCCDIRCGQIAAPGLFWKEISSSRSAFLKSTINFLVYVSDPGHNDAVKSVDFHARALEFIRAQSTPIRRQIGESLRDLQKGISLGMPFSRPMAIIAPGVQELRIRGEGTTVRIFYYLRRSDAIIVFHGFQKKAQKTPFREIKLARQRLQEVLNETIES
jgi:phage-related protein